MKMRTKQIILSRLMPKTGQEIEERSGDDGTHEAGWWRGLSVAENRTRFITKTLDGDDVVIDLATGLMWAADGNEAGCNSGVKLNWNDAIDYANSLDFAGLDDWRLPNIRALLSIVNYGVHSPTISEPPFANTPDDYHYSSTTFAISSAIAYGLTFAHGQVTEQEKTITRYIRCVRAGV